MADFIGESNFISGVVDFTGGAKIKLRIGAESITVRAESVSPKIGQPATFTLRPEKIALTEQISSPHSSVHSMGR